MTDNLSGMIAIVDAIKEKTTAELCALLPTAVEGVKTAIEREQVHSIFLARASEIGEDSAKSIESIYKEMVKAKKIDEKNAQAREFAIRAQEYKLELEKDKRGVPLNTVNNYRTIMLWDEHYKDVRYNLLKAAPEIHHVDNVKGTLAIRPWEDADEAESQRYIEEKFGLFSDQKHRKALLLLFREREYNPVMDIIEKLPAWDGEERICHFLTKWMGCEDTAYTREVSRLIFSGGINRLYMPGCKFDDVPVLIGVNQGEGKSTIIHWLAIHDDYYSEVTQFEGSVSVEQLEGAWICEISEMLALNKASEQESVKAFITRQVDKYRKPYAKNPSNLPRRCIFVGSTNLQNFLRDKTGNRRWYPIKVNMSAYNLFGMEQECRDYILLCWAEARDKYKQGKMPNFADRNLIPDYRAAQTNAMEDDWRDGAIKEFLKKKAVGERVCVRMIAREALPIDGDAPRDPTRMEAREIGLIVDKLPNWKRCGNAVRINSTYGIQRGWIKTAVDLEEEELAPGEELPF